MPKKACCTAAAPPAWSRSLWLIIMAVGTTPNARSPGTTMRSPASVCADHCGPASNSKLCCCVRSNTALPWPMSRASRSKSPHDGTALCHHSIGTISGRPSARQRQPHGITSHRHPSNPANPAHHAGCAKYSTATGQVTICSSSHTMTLTQCAAAVHSGGHKAPSMDNGVTTNVTHGMAHRLAIIATTEICPNSSSVSGASARPTTACSRNKRMPACRQRRSGALRSCGCVAKSTPTATKLSQNPACSKLQGSTSTTAVSTTSHT